MATETVSQKSQPSTASHRLLSGRSKRILRENLTAYLFLSPALLIVFAFGIFPIFFAGYVSLYKWRIKQNEYRGLANYVTAMGDVAYVFFFLIAIALAIVGILEIVKVVRTSKKQEMPFYVPFLSLIPGAIIAYGLLEIILRLITRFAQQEAIDAGEASVLGNIWLGLVLILIGVVLSLIVRRLQSRLSDNRLFLPDFTIPAVAIVATLGLAVILGSFTLEQLQQSERYGLAVVRIAYLASALVLLAIGYLIWMWGARQDSNRRLLLSIIAATVFIAGGVWLATIWPVVSKGADVKFYESLAATVWYSMLTVPVQLGIAMALAYMLYQPIWGKGPLRVIYFIPYIAPAVATAGIFSVLFSLRPTSFANQILVALGGEPVKWLSDPGNAVGTLLESFGLISPATASSVTFGPSLALLVVIFYNIWVFVGYDTVIFLAGLGNIPNTLYEAARIDGASSWKLFRHITFPLLSPTTYFLSVISIIGTFKAFTHIYVLRTPAAQGTMDTASVYFFVTFFRGARFGFSTSMAIVLFVIILVLYLIQNRIAQRSVFYG
ncbi:MAG: sugar ABC transporter permease [Anaerolineae bacterium]|nr:sugar ABC transporter permease [Anaerolineae bacterium]MCO5189725.1 sugar ABC transporter permease [Anaerolineae bacterium]MCO5193196.1 sugar ABC transporter permease [Anaerolineae bacterium]MCO5198141.1 sugar ABC transporter permease [Anaerolineae bacterium]MCO5205447.1 sugar ABC transporter permease [Anaerolineae bacterium]